jgi:hypothetical protein
MPLAPNLRKETIMRSASHTSRHRSKVLRDALHFRPEQLESRTLLSTYILGATDDTFVRGSTNGDTNYDERLNNCSTPLSGTSCLISRNDNGTNNGFLTGIVYLKFDTTNLAGAVNSANLRLFGLIATGTESFPGVKNDEVRGLADTAWTETTLTFNNRPLPEATALSSQIISGNTLTAYNWNVGAWVTTHLGGSIAFVLQSVDRSSLGHLYRTREWTTAAQTPKLMLSVGVPDAPRNLVATRGNGQIKLDWANTELDGDAVDVTSWSIYRATASGAEVLIASDITTNTYTDTVASGQDYFYYVIANNASGPGAPSNEVGPVRSLFGPPAPITVTEGIGTISLSWPAVTSADAYRIYRSETSGGTFVLQTEQAATTFNDNVAPGAKFFYKVSAINAAEGEGPLSPEIAATAGIPGNGTGISAQYYDNIDFTGARIDRIDPTVDFDFDTCCDRDPDPAIFNGSPDETMAPDLFSSRYIGDVQAVFTQPYTFYTASDDGVRLWLENATTHQMDLIIDRWVLQGTTEWASQPINLVAGQKYHIRLDFFENFGAATTFLRWESPSTPKEIIPQSQLHPDNGIPRIPAAPSTATASAIDSTSVCVLWNDVAYDEDQFVVQRSTDIAFTSPVNVVFPPAPNVASCQDTSVTAGTRYYYRVAAENTAGISAFTIANQRAVSSIARATGATTVTTAAAHGLSVGSVVNLSGVTPTTFNGTFTVLSVPTPTTLTFANGGVNDTATTLGMLVVATVPSGTPGPINFPSFTGPTPDITLVSGPPAFAPVYSAGRLRLTEAVDGASGAAWTTNVKVIDSFTASFDFQVTGSNGADGFTFGVQSNSNQAIGGAGGGLGWADMPNSVGIKFDFYYGPIGLPATPGVTQTGVHTNGDISVYADNFGTTVNSTTNIAPFGLDFDGTPSGTGRIYHVDVAYDGTTLVYTITDATDRTRTVSLHYTIDIAATIGSHCAYVGFTAANGGLHARQEILNFAFNSGVPVVNGTNAPDTFYVRLDTPGGSNVRVWKNKNPDVDPPDIQMAKASINNLALSGGAATDTFIIDFTNGNPLPSGGLLVDGGMNNDTLIVKGTSAAETFSINGTQVTVPGGGTFRHTGMDFGSFDLGTNVAGDPDDALNITAAPGFSPTLNGGGGNNTLTISNSNYTASADSLAGNNDGAGNPTLNVIANGTTAITSNSSQHLKSLALNGASRLNLSPGGSKLLRTRGLTIAAGTALDVGDGNVILQSTAGTKMADWNALMNLLRTGRSGGTWTGNGIRSASAAAKPEHATAVGIILNDNGAGGPILATFNGEPVDANTVLLKYTYYGDRDFDGDVDADDYAALDASFANRNNPNNLIFPRQPWREGDPNLSNSVNSDDFFLTDVAFSSQSTILSAPATPMATSSTTVRKSSAKSKARHRKVVHHRPVLFRVRD